MANQFVNTFSAKPCAINIKSSFCVPGDDLLEFHQAVLSTLREEEINAETFAADVQRLTELAEMSEGQEDENNDGEQGKLGACDGYN